MLAMLENDVRHVGPLADVRGPRGDRRHRPGRRRDALAVRAAARIAKASNKGELREAASRLNSTVITLLRAELAPSQVSEVTSAVADALIARMIELGVESQGPPPAEFCWMSLGSHGRREPVPSSDIDSGMAWRDVPEHDPLSEARRHLASTRTGEYMRGLAAHVADCVRVIGWRLDPHGVDRVGLVLGQLDRGLEAGDPGMAHATQRQPGADRELDPARRTRRLRAHEGAST